ncbi:MAG: cyclic nucleotide-binding domain-containing protein [Planctomycetes bacterium]|nr:cyclic nucleotide-binding domain-containing protein [Planctomycetota bacterium]
METLGAGDWFGEVNALSDAPSQATLIADSQCAFLELSAPLFKDLKRSKEFNRRIEESYRRRSLAIHLSVVPVFESISEDQLGQLQNQVEFVYVKKGDRLARSGEPADALYLVRSGAVKCSVETADRAEQVLSYCMSNSSFGEQAILDPPPPWDGDYVAMADTSVLRIPRRTLIETFDTATRTKLVESAQRIYDEDSAGRASDGARGDLLEVMVRNQSVKGGEALAIELDKCIRCNACVESCVAVHEDRVPRLSKTGYRTSGNVTLATSCYNCEIPECMLACPHGAIRRDIRGLIRFVFDNCVGCGACTQACPYDVISLTPPPTDGKEPKFKRNWFLRTLPFIGKRFEGNRPCSGHEGGAARELAGGYSGVRVSAKAIKCDLCAGLPFEACVYNCPTRAIYRVSPEELVRTAAPKEPRA